MVSRVTEETTGSYSSARSGAVAILLEVRKSSIARARWVYMRSVALRPSSLNKYNKLAQLALGVEASSS